MPSTGGNCRKYSRCFARTQKYRATITPNQTTANAKGNIGLRKSSTAATHSFAVCLPQLSLVILRAEHQVVADQSVVAGVAASSHRLATARMSRPDSHSFPPERAHLHSARPRR